MNPLRDFFEKLALEWDSTQRAGREETIHSLLSRFDQQLSHANNILDVGTGTGALIPILKQRYPNAKITSIDFAHQMCLRASERSHPTRIIQGDVENIPIKNLSFDAVICHNSFPHFVNKWLALMNFKRILKRPGELLILHDISRERVNEIHSSAQAAIIHQDLLPDAKILAKEITELGFYVEKIEDRKTHYLIYAQLPLNNE